MSEVFKKISSGLQNECVTEIVSASSPTVTTSPLLDDLNSSQFRHERFAKLLTTSQALLHLRDEPWVFFGEGFGVFFDFFGAT